MPAVAYWCACAEVLHQQYGSQADVYSAGVMAFMLLTGRYPSVADGTNPTPEQVRSCPLHPPNNIPPPLPPPPLPAHLLHLAKRHPMQGSLPPVTTGMFFPRASIASTTELSRGGRPYRM